MSLGHICHNERGAVLITGMVLLLLLTLFGVAAMQGATLQERMAGNLEQNDLAFQAAEAGLRDAEAWLRAQVVLPAFDGTGGCYTPASPATGSHWKNIDWNEAANFRTYQAGDLGDPPPYPLPRYIIEYMATVNIETEGSVKFEDEGEAEYGMYRVTSRGVSPNGRSTVMLQTTYIR
jgi:type IV pilus assembly protein PilX